MLKAIIIDELQTSINSLQRKISHCCPVVQICGTATTLIEAIQLIQSVRPELVFLETSFSSDCSEGLNAMLPVLDYELIFLSNDLNQAVKAFQTCAIGFVLKPVKVEELLIMVQKAQDRILEKKYFKSLKEGIKEITSILEQDQILGIPTIEGFDFIPVRTLIRCEGMQKCTRLVTTERSNLVSSYNIGEFRKILCPFKQFRSPHRSHLINMNFILKYYKEGNIIMADKAIIPLSRRRKQEFLESFLHL